MTQSLASPRGTRDILPAEQPYWRLVTGTAQRIAQQLGFHRIDPPTYEELALFQRSIGEGTDVMDKELFVVRGIRTESSETPYALRPEGTAGIVRAYIEHGMHTLPQPVKLWTFARNFRYDRPQKGRYREHIQFDIEYFGAATPFADAYTIWAGHLFLREVGLGDKVVCQINTLGTPEERQQYAEALRQYLQPHLERLSEDSRQRLANNPLRILDSKDKGDQELLNGAPTLEQSLSTESREYFEEVRKLLDAWQVPAEVNPRLVRGLDYYSHTAFEWVMDGDSGQQGSLGGGGRYDGLVRQLGGDAGIGAVGFGIGLDRVVDELQHAGVTVSPQTPHLFVAVDENSLEQLPEVLDYLAAEDLDFDLDPSRSSLGSQLKLADKRGALWALILQEKALHLKNLTTGEQREVELRNVFSEIGRLNTELT